MKTKSIAALCIISYSATARAASGAAEDGVGVFIWIFIGMIVLIMGVLMVPAGRSIRRIAADTEKQSETVEERLGPGN